MESDRKYLSRLQDYYAKYQVLPSYSAIGKLVGLRSKSSVSALVQRLKGAGFLEPVGQHRLRPTARFFERPVADNVRAGTPGPANDLGFGALTLDAYLVRRPSETSLYRVRGDSMVEAGILEGDLVLIEKRATANPGDIVLAIVDGEFTLKYLDKDRKGFYLRPGNTAFAPIRANRELEVFGVCVGLARRIGA